MLRCVYLLLAVCATTAVPSDFQQPPHTSQGPRPYYSGGQWFSLEGTPGPPGVVVEEEVEVVVEEEPPVEVVVVVTPRPVQEPYVLKEQDADAGAEDGSVWKVVVLVGGLLAVVMASLCAAYYLCVWRGGRIHYRPQHDLSDAM